MFVTLCFKENLTLTMSDFQLKWPGQKFGCLGHLGQEHIVRVSKVRVFLLALCSNLKTWTSRTKLSDFSLSELSNFSCALKENSDMSELKNTEFSDERIQISVLSKLSNFLAFAEKRNSVSLFYAPIDLLLITVDDIDLGQVYHALGENLDMSDIIISRRNM